MNNEIISEVKDYVEELFQANYDNRSSYHSFEHTKEVAEAAEKIGKGSGLNDEELEAVIIAAWFHDTGYLHQQKDRPPAPLVVNNVKLTLRQYCS